MKFITTAAILLGFSTALNAAVLEEYASGVATPETLGGYTMTDFAYTGSTTGTTNNVASPISGSLQFLDRYDNSEQMMESTADTLSWWNNGESFDYDVFLTNESLIKILLPENTRAFSFNVGADLNASSWDNAWLTATETSGSGVSKTRFNVTRANTPGFGIYVDNSAGACSSSLTSVTIDPLLWGFGNFSINQDTCTSVPEASSLYLLGIGLFGLLGFGLARRKA